MTGQQIKDLLRERQELRAQKRFAEADAIRDRLLEAGVNVQDRPDGDHEKPAFRNPWRELPSFFVQTREIPGRLIPPEAKEQMKRHDCLNKAVRIRGDMFATSWWRGPNSDEIGGAKVFLARDHPHLDRLSPEIPKAVRSLYLRGTRVAFIRATDAWEGGRRIEAAERALESYTGPIYKSEQA